MSAADAPNLNALHALLTIEELVRCGAGLFVLAPGSRSAPLAVAIARNPKAKHIVVLDERDAAYAAVGFARATGKPAVVVTTSGTAVANCLPAVVEADVDHVPLVILSADRPPELRATGANQTIEQPQLFGRRVRFHVDIACPDEQLPLASVLTTIDQAMHRATGADAGPVHLNQMFREPLAPIPQPWDPGLLAPLRTWLESTRPFTRHHRPARGASDEALQALLALLAHAERGVLALGRLDVDERPAALRIAAALQWPVIADVLSGARFAKRAAHGVPYMDAVLHDAAGLEPDVVLELGAARASKRTAQWLTGGGQRRHVVVAHHGARIDPAHTVTERFELDLVVLAEQLERAPASSSALAPQLSIRNDAIATAFATALDDDDDRAPTEPYVARALTRHLPADAGLFLGSSMPIRDVDMFGAPRNEPLVVASNRGASGIDGVVASAVGFAIGLGRPTTLLIGDLSLLHGQGGLALVKACPVPLTVVVVNNAGGGIFSFLPIAKHADVFETYFGTPHGVDLALLARAHGLDVEQPTTRSAFVEALHKHRDGHALIEVKTNREENHQLHEALRRQALDAVRGL